MLAGTMHFGATNKGEIAVEPKVGQDAGCRFSGLRSRGSDSRALCLEVGENFWQPWVDGVFILTNVVVSLAIFGDHPRALRWGYPKMIDEGVNKWRAEKAAHGIVIRAFQTHICEGVANAGDNAGR